ncbi:MAG: hypothetical protein ACOC3E_01415 [Cyanobacteriota bacterium]
MKVKDLLERYSLKTRQSLYDRLNGLNLALPKDDKGHGYATKEQIGLLDQLDEHLKNGGTIASFLPLSSVSIDTEPDTQLDTRLDTIQPSLDTLAELAIMMSQFIPRDPLAYMASLERAAASGWELKTSEVKALIGVKPTGNLFERGCWQFSKIPLNNGQFKRIGAELAWKVSKQN